MAVVIAVLPWLILLIPPGPTFGLAVGAYLYGVTGLVFAYWLDARSRRYGYAPCPTGHLVFWTVTWPITLPLWGAYGFRPRRARGSDDATK